MAIWSQVNGDDLIVAQRETGLLSRVDKTIGGDEKETEVPILVGIVDSKLVVRRVRHEHPAWLRYIEAFEPGLLREFLAVLT